MVKAQEFFILMDPDNFAPIHVYPGDKIPEFSLESGRVTNPNILGPDYPPKEEPKDEPEEEPKDDPEGDPDYSWKKADLVAFAEKAGIELDGSETKDDLLELIDQEG